MWIYSQSTGKLYHDGTYVAVGYSGTKAALNDPTKQAIRDVGPIPQGMWHISPDVSHEAAYSRLGSPCFTLTPRPLTVTFGRDGFLIHADRADAATNPHAASSGCIILPFAARALINASDDRILQVTA